ncbi:MAG TPA: FAD-binding oxidoreductase, partial [Thermoanaerobaculia bacterium]
MTHQSWGRWIRSTPARVVDLSWATQTPRFDDLVLSYGLGRSYGDVCLNNGHTLLDTHRMNRLLAFDDATGVLRCEGGASLDDILQVVVPRGWFLPVTPGTKFVTVGGCIANDVHGKNHHRAGTFGRHVRAFELLRSDGTRMHCTPSDPLFRATIGGLGMTGLVVWAEVQLRKIESPSIVEERIPFHSLAEFETLSAASDASHEYTVSWLDTFTNRGLFIRGNHSGGGGGG